MSTSCSKHETFNPDCSWCGALHGEWLVAEIDRLTAALAEAERERDGFGDAVKLMDEEALKTESALEAMTRELGWYRAAHVLIANLDVFIHAQGDAAFFTDAVFKDGKPGLALNLNDVFFWGCADAEDIEYADCPALLEIAKRDGATGLVAYARDKRMARGEGWDATHLATYTPELKILDRLRAAESSLSEAREAGLKAVILVEEALQLAAEGWSYASDYFREKWKYPEESAKIAAARLDLRRALSEGKGTT